MTELLAYCKGCKRSINSAMDHSFDGGVFYCEQCRPMDSLPVLDIAAMQERIAEREPLMEASNVIEEENLVVQRVPQNGFSTRWSIFRCGDGTLPLKRGWGETIEGAYADWQRKNQPKPTADEKEPK